MTLQFMTVQILTVKLRHVTREQQPWPMSVVAAWIKMPFGIDYGGRPTCRPRPHCVRWEPSSPTRGTAAPLISAGVYCGQMAGWIKMPLDTEVFQQLGRVEEMVFTARRSYASAVLGVVIMSVCPSVTRVLCD